MTTTRQPAVAGTFYSASPVSLQEMVDTFLDNVEDIPDISDLKALIVPHAGLAASGQVAAYGYKLLKENKKKKVILLGPAHTTFLEDVVCDEHDEWETPLGTVTIAENSFHKSIVAHRTEHCLEVQMPFLQTVLDDFTIIPLIAGDADPRKIAGAIDDILDDDTILIISSDLSHFNDYDTAVKLDNNTIDAIKNLDYNKMLAEGDACGKIPILTLIDIARRRGWKSTFLAYANSGDITGDNDRVVGYASFAIA